MRNRPLSPVFASARLRAGDLPPAAGGWDDAFQLTEGLAIQPFIPGPVQLWADVNNNNSPEAFGYSERGVNIDLHPRYSPYVVDVAGEEPLDWYYSGVGGTVSSVIDFWNEDVYAAMSSYVNVSPGRGRDGPGDIGTLVGTEGAAYPLFIVFPYQGAGGKTAYADGPRGYRFYLAIVERDSLPERGAKPAKLHLTWKLMRRMTITPGTGTSLGNAFLTLYDNDVSAINVTNFG